MATAGKDPYRLLARFYDRLIDPLNAGVRRVALRLDPPNDDWDVLDIGCGTGAALADYATAGCSVSGIDTSPAMLARAAERLGPEADLRLGAGQQLPYSDASFDRVLATMMLHEVPSEHREALVREALRVVRDDGRVLVIDFRRGSLRGVKARLIKTLSWLIERVGGHYSGYRSFGREGGVPGLADRSGAVVDREKIVAGGNLAIYFLRSDA